MIIEYAPDPYTNALLTRGAIPLKLAKVRRILPEGGDANRDSALPPTFL
jgi:hypothetical protein